MLQLIVAVIVLIALPTAAAECYSVDASGGRVSFEVKQAGAPFRGAFRRFGGEVCLEGGRTVRIDVWLEPASVATDLPEIDAALRDKEFFDAGAHPRLTFASTSIDAQDGRQIAHGTLSVKGKRRAADVPFALGSADGRRTVSGTFTLDRLQYGIGTGEWSDTRWLGAEVKVEFTATLLRR
ncbi:MAG: YceI family protein [Burkholderiaceae bacterium]|nr:YceI family protein [Burkholderiaceae bacterium]